MQAIETKYLGATNTRPSRIVARCEAGRIVVNKDYTNDDHRLAAMKLITKLGWFGHWIQAVTMSNPEGYVFVCHQRHEYGDTRNLMWKGPIEGFDVYPGALKDD